MCSTAVLLYTASAYRPLGKLTPRVHERRLVDYLLAAVFFCDKKTGLASYQRPDLFLVMVFMKL